MNNFHQEYHTSSYCNSPYCSCNNRYMTDPYYGQMWYQEPYWHNQNDTISRVKDHGKGPFVVNIKQAAEQNNTFRTTVWTGDNLQVTLMSLDGGEDIGLEVHPDVDQFLRIESGHGVVQMGKNKSHLDFQKNVYNEDAIMVPAGTWHNLTNVGHVPLKLYTIYAPPEHPFGTVHKTKLEAEAAEQD